ncbi:MAG: hypothetical protein ACI4U0_06960 [Candidatus Aphodocola sp.]
MTFNNYEMKKLFDFILINKNIVLSDYGLFSRDTLILLRDIIKGKKPNDFVLSKKQENALITAFLNGNCIFDEDTPTFILNNNNCINIAIERDINSANYIETFTPELSQRVLNIAISKKYILAQNSPDFLESNYAIALNSIRQDANSANFVNWDSMIKEDFDDLIQETINAGYLLSSESCYTLKDNPDIVLSSISKNINTLIYSSSTAKSHPKIFKYLIQNGHTFTTRELKEQSLYTYADYDTMKYAIEKLKIFDKYNIDFRDIFEDINSNDIDKYIERYIELFIKAFNTLPTIQNLKTVLQVCAESEWDNYREEHLDDYANIFGKICTELKNNNDYSEAINELDFLNKMQKALDDKYYLLLQAMEQYHSIIHSNIQLGNIDFARDQIAKLSALYVSISKENFKKEKIEEYFEDIKQYFIPRKTHPIIYKKLIEHKYKDKFKELYQNKDNDICSFLENIVKQYSDSIDNDTVWSMINNFLNNGYSKMASFIKAPRGWNNYKRYEEASKLINRLNSHYIKYTDQELVRYLDIIKYNFETDKYYYEGPSFDEESINRYNEYRKKLQLFEKIKQQIIFKAKKLEINSKILDDELTGISGDLPFTDEYFEFIGLNNCEFDLEDFVDSCVFDNVIEPSSLIDDEAYEILTNYVLNNGLVWMLLLINKYRNDSLDEIGIDKESILASFDYMKEVSRLSKIFKYDINKYEDVLALCELSECADDKTIAILGKDVIFKLCRYQDYTDEDTEEIVRMAKELVCKMTKRNKSTVPYVSGRTNNYMYSMYNPQDETILLAGINTDACFRIDGSDNDFLHYCALDKNGFVIKITDNFGNFIARASGFRNGNGVYINQLRTIYDEGGIGYEGSYEKEKNEIIETFYKACNDIVQTSQQNKNEQDKIDFVFATQSYALSRTESNVDRDVANKIGDDPMDTTSEDWKNFVNSTENLQEIDDEDDTFSTDYGNYDLICVASSKKHRIFGKLTAKDIKQKDVEAVYVSPRSKITATENPDISIINRINKINGINSYLNDTDFESIEIPKGTTIFIGDNWYIAHNSGVIIQSCVLDFDKKAVIEFEITKKAIQDFNINNNQQLNVEQVSQQLETQSPEGYARVLRINH